ncbi:MAG: acyl-CoA dehydrogenase/oxidase C-terminal [Monoraphidium minutum]|nr:MAG: acyl-CoA dehydrogenase/oxidase C-terminal [Monoraphidium minutum]
MGWRMQPTCAVNLEKVFVPSENLVGAEGQGFKIALGALDGGRINIGACSVGGGAFCLDSAHAYAGERAQFGQPIGRFQASQFKLADMATRLQASRLMVRHAARALDAQAPEATMMAAMAKRFATDECFRVALDAQQLLGGYGFLRDFPMERLVRDLRVHSILEGTNEVMRLVISRQLQRAMGA